MTWCETYDAAYNEFNGASDAQLIGIWEHGVYLTDTEYLAYMAVVRERGVNIYGEE